MAKKTDENKESQQISGLQIEVKKSHLTFWATIIVALIGLIGAITPTLVNYYKEQNIVQATQTAEILNMTQSAVLALSATPTSIPSPTSVPIAISTPVPVQAVQVFAPMKDQLGSFPYLTVSYLDINRPDTLTYKSTVSRDETYLWTYFWCAKSESALGQNLSTMKFSFWVDNMQLPESSFYVYNSQKDWHCQIWTAMLTGWGDKSSTMLSVVYLISDPISDGEKTYHPGAYRHDLTLSIY
jgi:hypothetical protein